MLFVKFPPGGAPSKYALIFLFMRRLFQSFFVKTPQFDTLELHMHIPRGFHRSAAAKQSHFYGGTECAEVLR